MLTPRPKRSTNLTRANLWLDLALFAAMMLALAPALTGLAVHEWLSLALAAALIIHLLLHWQWIVTALRRFFGHLAAQSRINLALNLALFIDLTLIIFTGLMISREALPLLGITPAEDRLWSGLHRLTADLSVFLVGLHVAVHWKWIASAVRRYLVNPVLNLGRRPQPVAQPIPVRSEVK
jgi:hypothetical protein